MTTPADDDVAVRLSEENAVMSDVNCPHGSNSRCDCYAAVETAAAERILAGRRPADEDGLRAQLDEVAGIADDNRIEALEAIERAEAAEAERDQLRADIEALANSTHDDDWEHRLRAVLARHPAEP